jgi:hypothetical protein
MEKHLKRASADDALAPPSKKAVSSGENNLTITDEERSFLMEHGYLVKLNVVPDEDCERSQLAFEESLKLLNPASASKSPQDWRKGEMPANAHGIQEMGKLAHQGCVTDIRLHPNVVSVWRSLLRTNDICSSWDRVNYMPIAMTDTAKPWHHTDVDPSFDTRTDIGNYFPIQSYVQVSRTSDAALRTKPLKRDENGADPCIVLWEYSNLAHAEYFRRKGPEFKLKARNWHIYEPETIQQWERDGREFLPAKHAGRTKTTPFPMSRLEIRAPRGAMVFWLSTTAHMNMAGKPTYPRFVIYTCFGPSRLLTKKDRENFWKAMSQLRCTSHWPCAGEVKLFPKVPHLFSADRVEQHKAMEARLDLKPLVFTPAQLKLLPPPLP